MSQLQPHDWEALLARTPARLAVGRAGLAYRSDTLLRLREDHAAARDAVHAEFNPSRDLPGLECVEVATRAATASDFLRRPDWGRLLTLTAAEVLREQCCARTTVQLAIAAGLSATAVARQAPLLVPELLAACTDRGWSLGRTIVVRHGRVGIMNEIGAVLQPAVVVLLIGERPGLATAESMSAYLAYQPRPGHTDAQRNLISNIHARGIATPDAVVRIVALIEQMLRRQLSGVELREEPTGQLPM